MVRGRYCSEKAKLRIRRLNWQAAPSAWAGGRLSVRTVSGAAPVLSLIVGDASVCRPGPQLAPPVALLALSFCHSYLTGAL